MTQIAKNKILILTLATLFTVLMIGLAIYGGYQAYSPIPFWDMWDGVVDFFLRVNGGETTVWWSQHNEHRILLSRLLFWVDLKMFSGSNLFLIVVNYFLVGSAALLYWRIIRATTGTRKPSTSEIFFGFIITAWLFLWSQNDNFTGAFQSQFLLAQLLPLCALYLLSKATEKSHSNFYFVIACVFGTASVVTMANGLFALPLMVFYAILTQQGRIRICSLIILTIISFVFYFYDYHAVIGHGSLLNSIKNNPLGLFNYILVYLGNPFYFLFKSKAFAWFAGLILLINSMIIAIQLVFRRSLATLKLALLFYVFYIEITAFCTGGGRLIFGLDQALTSRYTTPSIMAWAALFILYLPAILAVFQDKNKKFQQSIYGILIMVFSVCMLRSQFEALQSWDNVLFERKIGVLALGLGINDPTKINNIYPYTERVLSIAKEASAQNVSIFGIYPFSDVRRLGIAVTQPELPMCQDGLSSTQLIDTDKRFVRVTGWLDIPATKTHTQLIRFLNSEHEVVGYAFTGKANPRIPYEGYLLANQTAKKILLQGDSLSCQMVIFDEVIAESSSYNTTIAKQ